MQQQTRAEQNQAILSNKAVLIQRIKEKLTWFGSLAGQHSKTKYVVVADNNSTVLHVEQFPNERMAYTVKKGLNNQADVNVFTNLEHHTFDLKSEADRIAANFGASNGRGPLKWYVVTEKEYYLQALAIEEAVYFNFKQFAEGELQQTQNTEDTN